MGDSMELDKKDSPRDLTLVRTVRSLDHGGAETIPEKLTQLWAILSISTAGRFHASEEMILRWLLKHMNGSSAEAEKVRRYPLAWNILDCVFGRIPLFSLAKSLADRRFVVVLQQALKDICNPQKAAKGRASDVDMKDVGVEDGATNSRKRKRSSPNPFDLQTLKEPHGCLMSAESLLKALQTLLGRIEVVAQDGFSNDRMGAEHLKSLFSMSAVDIIEILRPILSICDIALSEQSAEPLQDQTSWTSTFTRIWTLHLQGRDDALEVATGLSLLGTVILGQLLDLPQPKGIVIHHNVKDSWVRDLRRFFVANMILPARAAFLNRKDVQILVSSVEVTNLIPATSSPVLFSLVLKAPRFGGEGNVKKDNQDWIQKAFEILEEPLRSTKQSVRNQVIEKMLDMAIEARLSLPLSSLWIICNEYALTGEKIDWPLVGRIADCDVDAFLVSPDGPQVLSKVLQRMHDDVEAEATHIQTAVHFAACLATGFAKARDFSGFVKCWFENLVKQPVDSDITTFGSRVWKDPEIGKTVASLLQASLSPKQLQSLLDWLLSHTEAAAATSLLLVLEAIANGISEEEYIDAVKTRLFEATVKTAKTLRKSNKSTVRWNIIKKTISWSSQEEVGAIWSLIEKDLRRRLLKRAGEADQALFACCIAAWLANYPGGQDEAALADLAHSAFEVVNSRLGNEYADQEDWRYFFCHSPRFIDLAVKEWDDTETLIKYLKEELHLPDSAYSETLVSSEIVVNNRKLLDVFIDFAIQGLAVNPANKPLDISSRGKSARVLLHTPNEAFTRQQREKLIESLLNSLPTTAAWQDGDLKAFWKDTLSLMAKVLRRPTYYEGMKFSDLVRLADSFADQLFKANDRTSKDLSAAYDMISLYEEVAFMTFRQMTLNNDAREREYFVKVSSLLNEWPGKSLQHNIRHLILLRAVVLAMEQSVAMKPPKLPIDLVTFKEALSMLLAMSLATICRSWAVDHDLRNPTLLAITVLDRLDVFDRKIMIKKITALQSDLERISQSLCGLGYRAGWKLKSFLLRLFGKTNDQALNLHYDQMMEQEDSPSSNLSLLADKNDILEYIDTVIANLDSGAEQRFLVDLARGKDDERISVEQFYAMHRVLQRHDDSGSAPIDDERVDPAAIYTLLAQRLAKPRTSREVILTAQIMHMLLDKKGASMTQWNIEVTLSSISFFCSAELVSDAVRTPKTYKWLCHLLEIILKRHRLRLEGHLHLLIATLQSLLAQLLSSPHVDHSARQTNAKQFSRLLTLVCEPSVASVARSQQGSLDSATDLAKRYAGQHMYLVLMSYIKLQLEQSVPRSVREALEPGIYSILDITAPEMRRVMNDAMDGSGRAIFKELYKQYMKFGKWSGI